MDNKKYFEDREAVAFAIDQMARQVFMALESLERLAMTIDLNEVPSSQRMSAMIQSTDSWLTVVPGMIARIRAKMSPAIERDPEKSSANWDMLSQISKETREL